MAAVANEPLGNAPATSISESDSMLILLRKELLSNLLTLRLSVAFVATLILVGLTTYIGSLNYSLRVDAYRSDVAQIRDDLEQATVYSQVAPDVIVPPEPLSIFCLGVDRSVGSRIAIDLSYIPLSPLRSSFHSTDTNLMKTLIQVDFTLVVTLILSFLAVALGFDGVCGERERGTLAQVLTTPTPRGVVIVAKILGGCLSLWIPLTVAFVVGLLIALGNADIALMAEDGVRLALFFVLSCLFLAQVLALSLMVSTFTHSSATSLVICLFGWLLGGLIYMNAVPSLIEYGTDEIPFREFGYRAYSCVNGR